MGGRGASSGVSKAGNDYGTQYTSYLTVGRMKFVSKVDRQSEPLMETMTKGRVYVIIGGDKVKSLVFFDEGNKRIKQIDVNHYHKGITVPYSQERLGWHAHHGYLHNENDGAIGGTALNIAEYALVAQAIRLWDNHRSK